MVEWVGVRLLGWVGGGGQNPDSPPRLESHRFRILISCRWLGGLGVRLLGWVGVSKPRPPPPETELEQTDFFRILIFLEDKKLLSGGGRLLGPVGENQNPDFSPRDGTLPDLEF